MMAILMFGRSHFFGYEQPDDDEELNNQERSYNSLANHFIKLLIIEIQLTFIYCVVALVSTYTLNITHITRMKLKRWIIESFYAPLTIYCFFYVHYVYRFGEHIYNCNRSSYTQFTSIIKVIIFVIIRYMELYPSSTLNSSPISLFYRFCNSSDKQYMHELYFPRFFLNDKTLAWITDNEAEFWTNQNSFQENKPFQSKHISSNNQLPDGDYFKFDYLLEKIIKKK
ncbi:unnamed protein product [Rotaria magnacalcarata]|uniref:Uncharacterized protein n=1 Tax=Rotaria magnacalcarata TaxID=392030 RepID=A0A816P0Y3_9BILA|nr:unnamed protein product [Rotaria magnacalcarata]